jgi:hypothetical protein
MHITFGFGRGARSLSFFSIRGKEFWRCTQKKKVAEPMTPIQSRYPIQQFMIGVDGDELQKFKQARHPV